MAILETSRFRLHPVSADRPGDRELFCHLYTDKDVMRWIAAPLTQEAAERGFARACAYTASDNPGHRFWMIDDKVSDVAVGMAGLLRKANEAEFGVMLRREWWKAGVSSETLVEIIAHAFGPMGLDLITAERPDDDHALVIDRMFGRFGFARTPERASAPTHCRWELPRSEWLRRTMTA